MVVAVMQRFGKVDIALLNAGIEGHVGLLTEYPADAFDKVIAPGDLRNELIYALYLRDSR